MEPLFRGHPLQSVAAAAGAAVAAAFFMKIIPSATHVYNMTQTAVAVLALAFMAVFVVMHHRQGGRMFTQTQEELILIAAFGLFCFAVMLASKAFKERSVDIGTASQANVGSKHATEAGLTGGKRPYPCANDAVACIVEEWSWF